MIALDFSHADAVRQAQLFPVYTCRTLGKFLPYPPLLQFHHYLIIIWTGSKSPSLFTGVANMNAVYFAVERKRRAIVVIQCYR